MPKTSTLLSALLLITAVACDKKADEKKSDDKAAKTDDKKAPDAKAGDAPAPEPEPTPEPTVAPPKLTEAAVGDWGIKVGLPDGAKVDAIEAGDAEMEMPDSTTLTVEDACGYDIELTRHWSKSLDSMYENSKKMVDGLTEVEWLKDEKTATGYTIHYKGKAPLGDMYGMSRGLVVGDRLVLCDSGLGRSEKHEAACLLAICESIAPAS
jgi:hypothetical protein